MEECAPSGRLDFQRVGERTVVCSALPMGPMRLLTPRNHGRAAWAFTSSLGGGFVDGDEVRLDLRVAPGAAAFVSTQGPARVYRSPRGCTSEIRAEVARDGLLALVPDPTACFADARFRSAEQANNHSNDYVLAVVLLASVLLFAGLATKTGRYRELLFGLGLVIFVSTLAWLASSPIRL